MKKFYVTLILIALLLASVGTVSAFHINQGCYTLGECTYCHFIMYDDNGQIIDSSFWSIGYGCGAQG